MGVEQLDELRVRLFLGDRPGHLPVYILKCQIGAAAQQQPRHLGMPLVARHVQRRVLIRVRAGRLLLIDVRAVE